MPFRPQTLKSLREGLIALPQMMKRPALMRLWLLNARRAHIGLGIALIMLTLVAPPAIESVCSRVYPKPLVATPVFHFVKSYRRVLNPQGEKLYLQLLTASWLLGLAVVGGLFIAQIPNAVSLGRQRAEFLMAKAARLSEREPAQSELFRARADDLLIPGNEVAELSERLLRTMPIQGVAAKNANYIGSHHRYRLDRVIAGGGMGTVHAGYDTVLQRLVAIKQLFRHVVTDTQQVGRFRREALALAKLSHKHIVSIYDLFEDEQSFWIVMELLTGGSLDEHIKKQTALSVDEAVEITCCIAEALGFAHAKRIIHRDVKPMNILFAADGTAKLTDFGNVKLDRSSFHTHEGLILGSPGYLSPEQATGESVDKRSDIYSLGISLYQMLTGKVPFDGDTSAILAQHITRKPQRPSELNPEIPAELESTILLMLEKNPSQRFQNTDELIEVLREVVPADREWVAV